jgi:signal transduction histidine kinase
LDENVSLSLYRTAQESLRNVAKHSHAQHVKVELLGMQTDIRLRVSDDGIGFLYDEAKNGRGLGLVSMRERMRLVGGEFSVSSHASLGTQVEAIVPIKATLAQSA